MALLLAMTAASVLVFANTTRIPTQGATTIVPNSLVINWDDDSREPITIETFRFFGFNVAQLRTMVGALDGTISTNGDGTFQIMPSGSSVRFSPVTFNVETEIDYIVNQTNIRNHAGTLVSPSQPGWVFLTRYEYNWASVRDVIDALNLTLVDVTDDPETGITEVTVARPLPPDQQQPSERPPSGPAARPPDTRGRYWSGHGPFPTPITTPGALTPTPTTSPGGLDVTPSPGPGTPMPSPDPEMPMPSPSIVTPMPTPIMTGYGSISGLVLSTTRNEVDSLSQFRTAGLRAGVTLHSSINSPPLDSFRTTTGALGVYSIGDIPVGQYYVRIEAEDYVPEFIHITVQPDTTTYVPTLRAVRLDEDRTSTLHGYILDGRRTTGSRSLGIQNLQTIRVTDPITLEIREGLTQHGRIVEEVDVLDGVFTVDLPIGNYHVTARGNGYHSTQILMFNWLSNSLMRQNISISPINLSDEAFRIELSFNNPDSLNLHSHLRGPTQRNGYRQHLQQHVNDFIIYGGRIPAYLNDVGRNLGGDGGTIRINIFDNGRYDYYVHNAHDPRREEQLRTSSATVRVFDEYNNLLRTFHVPSTGVGDGSILWHVFSIEVRDGQRTIIPVNAMYDEPSNPHDVGS